MAAYLSLDEHAKATGLLQVLRPDGTSDEDSLPSGLDKDLALKMYRGMLQVRIMDERLMALQRQGRIGFYGEARGQEAAVVGSAAALRDGDWIVPALREAGVGIFRGMSLRQYIAQILGNASDNSKGRQMPCHPCDPTVNYVVMSSCVSTQIPHAVGIAMAMRLKGDIGKVAIGYMGDGGTSEGDFHAAANFAGVFKPPVVLFCQNNQWAISTPGTRQTASQTVAIKGLAYGLESLRVDGNDVLAVFEATRYACEKARRGDGPTFIEALTYRVSAHSSSDDPSRYRDETVTLDWRTNKDPLVRFRKWLSGKGWLGDAEDARLAEELEAEVREATAAEEKAPLPDVGTMVDDVYEVVPRHLREQLNQYLDDRRHQHG
ncbi:MAG: 3-methyl-2-oxobutanoate dehydrogenase [Deltaproteobacteria bacterium]|nr:3-methyl-2-oxobutanoate dehydrogenase [Deltaproteobacteria bacterium]